MRRRSKHRRGHEPLAELAGMVKIDALWTDKKSATL